MDYEEARSEAEEAPGQGEGHGARAGSEAGAARRPDPSPPNVNGGIELREIAGAGSARTVNGKVQVWYSGAPKAACSFKTVNGRVEVYFPPSLAADMQFKPLNGGVYTAFPVNYLPRAAGTAERRDGKFVYRASRATSVRAGAGGPELKFETLNGDIQVRSREE